MKGKCYYCNKELSERTVKRHVKGCKVRKEKLEEAMASSKKTKSQYILSIVPQYGSKEYCLYIAIDIDLTLQNLDSFLRNIWLECCGHLSSFIIDDVNYDSSVDEDSEFFYEDETMDFKLAQVISVGDKFRYDYDFGSTTTLKLEVIDEYLTGEKHSQIEILARNEEIQNFCANCNQEAKYFDYEEEKFFCEDCIDEDADMVGEFVYTNSPRDGVCGYEGDRDTEKQYLPGNNFKYKKSKTKGQKDIVPFVQDDKLGIDDYEGDFASQLDSAMNDIDLEIENKANEMFNKVKRGKFTHNLRELLECNTKTELLKITSILKITKVSKFNKGQLVEILLDVYQDKITEALCLIDSERFEFLKNVADKNGYISFEDHDFTLNPEYFLEYGFVFASRGDDGIYLIMPNETISAIKSLDNDEYRKILAKNTELVKLFWGMTYNYGVLFMSDFTKMLNNYVDYSLDETDIYGIIVSGEDYYDGYIMQGNIASSIMAPLEDVIHIINARENISSDSDFCIIKKDELLESSNEEYLVGNKISRRFKRYLKNNWKMEDSQMEMIIINLYADIQENEKEEVIENILYALGEAGENDLEKLLVEINSFLNNIRLWRLKGYTLNELNSEHNNASTPKIGRNDLCMCGSGKKYKKCCGSKVIQLF
ncbi:SEC-C domain-containing protein [Clostridium bowmanii]|uniref:SEC-C metal-binding domain-containing protein n=1 Tax=Clostridium bowmanii TaxID=132925 RepID=UPI001C0CFCC4|nr:SEC-C metal-binding domain-containing protein [Clostridium bowmanii]MBU3189610.1 SEC-C domain-containing protein [Clostridium bowmanii]MCA1073546.1 SEC-C domain-containing protein [Clostridium bowmanii]